MIPLRRLVDLPGNDAGEDRTSGALFSYVDIEARIGAKHPLREMRRLANAALDGKFSAC